MLSQIISLSIKFYSVRDCSIPLAKTLRMACRLSRRRWNIVWSRSHA